MSSIKQALSKLKSSINKLEGGVSNLQFAIAGQQRDMFGAPINKPATAQQQAFAPENAVIAQRLDKAIKKVEELLEG